MKTKVDVINETVEYYKTHPRSRDPGTSRCLYNGPNGSQCAFAFWVEDNKKLKEGMDADVLLAFGCSILKKEVQHITDKRFWKELQRLHDFTYNWRTNSMGGQDLSPKGESNRDFLIKKYS